MEDGYAGLFGPSISSKTDEDDELNIDGDDTIQFGQAQYPLIPLFILVFMFDGVDTLKDFQNQICLMLILTLTKLSHPY